MYNSRQDKTGRKVQVAGWQRKEHTHHTTQLLGMYNSKQDRTGRKESPQVRGAVTGSCVSGTEKERQLPRTDNSQLPGTAYLLITPQAQASHDGEAEEMCNQLGEGNSRKSVSYYVSRPKSNPRHHLADGQGTHRVVGKSLQPYSIPSSHTQSSFHADHIKP